MKTLFEILRLLWCAVLFCGAWLARRMEPVPLTPEDEEYATAVAYPVAREPVSEKPIVLRVNLRTGRYVKSGCVEV